MSVPDDLTAASSPAAEPTAPLTATDQAVIKDDVAAYRDARRAERAGKPLTPSAAEIDTAEPAEQDASTEAKEPQPASEPGTPAKPNAQTRKAELKAEIDALLKQRADLRREVQTAAPAPAVPVPATPAPLPADKEPTIEDFAGEDDPYEALLLAKAERRARLVMEAERAQVRQHTEQQTRQSAYKARIDDAVKADPEFFDKVTEAVANLSPSFTLPKGTQPSAANVLADHLMGSEQCPALLLHLSANPHVLQSLLASPNAVELARSFGRLEGSLERSSAEPVTPTPKTITDAPAVPRTVGHRAADTGGDEVENAVRNDDVPAYRAARLRQRAAGLR